MLQAESDPGQDSFWQFATVRDSVSRSTAPAADRDAVLHFVDAESGRVVDGLDVRDSKRTHTAHESGGVPNYVEIAKPPEDGSDLPGQGGENEGGGTPRCCIKRFCYPERWNEKVKASGSKTFVGIRFMARIEYKKPADETGCLCECCVFKQFVQTWGNAHAKDDDGNIKKVIFVPPDPDVSHEDCRSKSEPGWNTGQEGGPPPGTDPEEDLECFGDRGTWGMENGDKDEWAWNDHKDPCRLWFKDTPGFWTEKPPKKDEKVGGVWFFSGMVFDKCNNMKLVEAKHWMMMFKTTVPPSGDFSEVWTTAPPRGPVREPKDRIARDGRVGRKRVDECEER